LSGLGFRRVLQDWGPDGLTQSLTKAVKQRLVIKKRQLYRIFHLLPYYVIVKEQQEVTFKSRLHKCAMKLKRSSFKSIA